MPVVDKNTLKGYFNNGDVPNESNYIDLIDSMMPNTVRTINVLDYGAVGDGTTDDTDAIQAAFDEISDWGSGLNVFVSIYLPAGRYKVGSSLDLTNKRYFMIKGDGWAITEIISNATNRPALDMLGARYFDLENFMITGDSTNTPTVGMFFGRTSASPNCGNCFIDSIALNGKFTNAGIYSVNAEVFFITRLRSGPSSIYAPFVYYADNNNAYEIVSDYTSISYTYVGSSQFFFENWWLTTHTSVAATCIKIGNGTWHGASLRNIYCNLFNGTGYILHHAGSSNPFTMDNVYGEGSYAGVLNFDGAQIAHFKLLNVPLTGLYCHNSSYLVHGVIENCASATSGSTVTFEQIDWCRLYGCWTYVNQYLTITDGDGNDIEWADSSRVTISAGYGNSVRDSSTSPRELNLPALSVGGGAVLTKILKATANIDFSSISAGAEGNAVVSLTGSAYGYLAIASPRTSLETGLIIKNVVAETNQVRIYLYNYTNAAIDPAAKDWTVMAVA